MGRIVVTEYLSLDGVVEEPAHWSRECFNEEAGKFQFDELLASDVQRPGRATYEGCAAAWPTMTDTSEFGERLNGMPKYVVSASLRDHS